ncbi:TBP-associated factor 5, partial [Striga asiatica]
MDPLTPNRVAFPGLAGLACARSRPAALPKPIIISVPKPHCFQGSASKPYVELPPHTAPLGMEVGPAQACAVKVVVHTGYVPECSSRFSLLLKTLSFKELKAWDSTPRRFRGRGVLGQESLLDRQNRISPDHFLRFIRIGDYGRGPIRWTRFLPPGSDRIRTSITSNLRLIDRLNYIDPLFRFHNLTPPGPSSTIPSRWNPQMEPFGSRKSGSPNHKRIEDVEIDNLSALALVGYIRPEVISSL